MSVLASVPVAFVDTETDGVHPTRKVWEVAIIRREPDGAETIYESFVDIDLSTADPFGLRVGRFYDRHPLGQVLADPHRAWIDAYGRSGPQVARAVAQLTHGAHIVGCVPGFDTGCLDPLLRAHGLAPAWHYQPQDVETLIAGYLRGQGKPVALPLDSEGLSREIGVEPPGEDERHTALGDARWAMRMWDTIMGVQL